MYGAWLDSYAWHSESAVKFEWHMNLYIPFRAGIVHTKRTAAAHKTTAPCLLLTAIYVALVNLYTVYHCNKKTRWGMADSATFISEWQYFLNCSWSVKVHFVRVVLDGIYVVQFVWYVMYHPRWPCTLNNIGSLKRTLQYNHHATPGEPCKGSPGVAWWYYWRVPSK